MRAWHLRLHGLSGLLALVAGVLVVTEAGAIDIEKLVMPGEVSAVHAKYEAECSACHVAFERQRQNALCIDCHQTVGADQLRPGGFHGLHPEAGTADCASCHTEHAGREAPIVIFDESTFDHAYTDFALEDKHATAKCGDCHRADALYREAPRECYACHAEDDVHDGGLGEICADCHMAKGWTVVEFEHEVQTGFALLGGHATAGCSGCHSEQNFANTPTDCVACHRSDDVHRGARGDDCADCHNETDWRQSFFNHARATRFPLRGAHAQADCEQCHTQNMHTVKLAMTCISCHADDDVHEGLLGTDCAACHGDSNWQQSRFRHETDTRFPLLGGHVSLGCESCHARPVHEANPGTDCIDCHRDDDPHAGQQGEACGDCHDETDWNANVRFDHDFTAFPLVGRHREPDCGDCHETSRFADAPVECSACHREDDAHDGALGPDCGACHNPADWSRWRFDHLLSAGFALDGAHADLVCADCHRSPARPGRRTPSTCIACHRNDDVHNGQFGRDCARCHSTRSFSGAEQR